MKQPLDQEKMEKYTSELSMAFANVIISRERTKENHAAAVAALCDVAVLISCKLVGRQMAYEDIIPMAIAHGFKMFDSNKEQMNL